VIIAANKVINNAQEVSRKDFESLIERKVDVVVPFDPKPAAQAAKLGQPLAKVSKSSKLAQALNQLLKLTLEHADASEAGEEKQAEAVNSLLGKLGSSFASLGKKKETAKVALAK